MVKRQIIPSFNNLCVRKVSSFPFPSLCSLLQFSVNFFLFYLHILCNNDVFLPLKFGAGNWLVTGKIDLLAHALSSTAVLCDIVKLHYVA